MTPLACSLDTNDLADRRDRWHRVWARAGIAVEPTGRGLRLTFRDIPDVASEVATLVELERACCAFADWSLQAGVLDISGDSAEAIAAVQGMFRSLPAQSVSGSGRAATDDEWMSDVVVRP